MGSLRAIYIIWYRELLRVWREKMRLVSALAFPLLFLVVFGGGLSSSMGMLAPGVNFRQFLFPGIISMTVLMTGLMSGVSIVWDREFGFLKEVLVAPISRWAVAVGKTLGGATVAIVQGTLIIFLAPLLGVDLSVGLVLELLPLMFLVAFSLAALGILLASRMKSMETFQVMMQMLTFPMIFLSGVFFPMGNLPSWMNVLVKLNPATYAVDAIRQVVLRSLPEANASGTTIADSNISLTLFGHHMSILDDVIIVAVFGTVLIILAMWSFSIQE